MRLQLPKTRVMSHQYINSIIVLEGAQHIYSTKKHNEHFSENIRTCHDNVPDHRCKRKLSFQNMYPVFSDSLSFFYLYDNLNAYQ